MCVRLERSFKHGYRYSIAVSVVLSVVYRDGALLCSAPVRLNRDGEQLYRPANTLSSTRYLLHAHCALTARKRTYTPQT